jgi:MYXO-CTERM domain-containing protein
MQRASIVLLGVAFAACSAPARTPIVLGAGGAIARIDDGGAALTLDGHSVSIGLASIGRGEQRACDVTRVRRADERVELVHEAGIVEWWRAESNALEHGVTIAARPAGDGALTLALAVTGLTPRQDGDAIALADDSRDVARYAGLMVLDARGDRVPATMHASDATIRIVVDDARAHYPLIVDPTVAALEATLTVPGTSSSNGSIANVAISGDGMRAIIGAPGGTTVGEAVVYANVGAGWALEATLPPPSNVSGFGTQVAICDNGSRAVVMGSGSSFTPPVAAYVRAGTTWTADPPFGFTSNPPLSSIAISGDCSLVAIGLSGSSTSAFRRAGAGWNTAYVDPTRSGISMSLDSGGTHLLMLPLSGAPTAYTFSSFGVWQMDGAPGPTYATSAALSGDGMRAVYGTASFSGGTATVWSRSGATWTQEGTIRPSDAAAGDGTGMAVALNHDGSVALVDSAGSGHPLSAVLFRRSGTTWTEDVRITDSTVATPTTYDSYGSLGLTAIADRAIIAALPMTSSAQAATADVFTLAWMAPNGTACTADGACASGFCVDSFCCDTTCERGMSNVCQGCGHGTTGAVGTCSPLVSGTTCRASTTSSCDPAEVCNGVSTTCPADVSMCMPDAGTDAATNDAGTDASASDAGRDASAASDAAPIDGGMITMTDAGSDAGARDAGGVDATRVDASGVDAASAPAPTMGGCGCRTQPRGAASPMVLGLTLVMWTLRRRRAK